jgi:hypothetical protein
LGRCDYFLPNNALYLLGVHMSVKHYDWSAYNAYVRPNKTAIRDLTSK